MLLLALFQGAALALLLVRLLPGRRRRPPVSPAAHDGEAGEISVIVAALNEARRIGPCLEGLAAQGAEVGEILIVDSGSTDGTISLVEAMSARDARFRVLRDDPLPEGWVGKVWALQHGLRFARGSWVLGIDADTEPKPGMAAGALAAAREHRYDAVSFAPRFRIESAGERWLQPALLVTLVYRFGAAGADADAERVMANGQCFLARRDVLEEVGGYSSARASFSDDVTLARTIARAGRRVGFLDGSRLYDVRSYTSAREAWREWGRSLDLKDSSTHSRQWADVLFLLVAQGTPIVVLLATALLSVFATSAVLERMQPLVLTSGLLLGVRLLLLTALAGSYARRGLLFWISPLADPLAAVRILISTVRRPRGWRGRDYSSMRQATR